MTPPDFHSELIPTRLDEFGKSVRLQLLISKPSTPGPYPTLIFNHGSTGTGRSPVMFRRTAKIPPIASFFNARGWMTIFPQRRGRGKSDGLYDEGFKPDRSGYACQSDIALSGVDRAIEDLVEVMRHVQSRPDVRCDRLLVSGVSRGGVLALAFAAKHPNAFIGAINFVGGWLGKGCASYAQVNATLFTQAAAFKKPTMWLYGTRDTYYPIDHCKRNFEAFVAAGGHGAFYVHRAGHALAFYPKFWEEAMDGYLAQMH